MFPKENGLGRLGLKVFRHLQGEPLAPAARADVTLDKFARIRWLEADTAIAALAALRRILMQSLMRDNFKTKGPR